MIFNFFGNKGSPQSTEATPPVSRRDFLRGRLLAGAIRAAAPIAAVAQAAQGAMPPDPVKKSVFVVARDCLAYQSSFCSVCREQCPVEGAIKIENGRPFIQADRCTACGICREVCPAPRNAILILEKSTESA